MTAFASSDVLICGVLERSQGVQVVVNAGCSSGKGHCSISQALEHSAQVLLRLLLEHEGVEHRHTCAKLCQATNVPVPFEEVLDTLGTWYVVSGPLVIDRALCLGRRSWRELYLFEFLFWHRRLPLPRGERAPRKKQAVHREARLLPQIPDQSL